MYTLISDDAWQHLMQYFEIALLCNSFKVAVFKPGARLVSWNRFRENVGMCVCLYVATPSVLKTIHVKWSLNNQSNKSYCFSMTLAIDITDGRGLSNEARRELLSNKNKVMQC